MIIPPNNQNNPDSPMGHRMEKIHQQHRVQREHKGYIPRISTKLRNS